MLTIFTKQSYFRCAPNVHGNQKYIPKVRDSTLKSTVYTDLATVSSLCAHSWQLLPSTKYEYSSYKTVCRPFFRSANAHSRHISSAVSTYPG